MSDFFLTSDDFDLIRESLEHYADGKCACLDLEKLAHLFDLTTKITGLSHSELGHLEDSWQQPIMPEDLEL